MHLICFRPMAATWSLFGSRRVSGPDTTALQFTTHTRVHELKPRPAHKPPTSAPLRILLFSSSFNGMTAHIQRVLTAAGHRTRFTVADSSHTMLSAYAAPDSGKPDVIVCPTLRARIPSEIYSRTLTLVLHPGVVGDRGPHSLDWAILNGVTEWGLTVLEAAEEMDGGRVWATGLFPMPVPALHRTKAQVYNDPVVVHLASSLVLQAVEKAAMNLNKATDHLAPTHHDHPFQSGSSLGVGAWAEIVPLREPHRTILATDAERVVDWNTDTTDVVLRKMRAADSAPGLRAILRVGGHTLTRFLYNGSPATPTVTAPASRLQPGELYAREADGAGGGIYVTTKDGAVRVGQLRALRSSVERRDTFKTPSTIHLSTVFRTTSIPVIRSGGVHGQNAHISFEIVESGRKGSGAGRIGILRYEFYNGAMSTADCLRLGAAYESAVTLQPTLHALFIVGAANGINLNVSEHAESPEREAYANLLAINALVKAIIRSTHLLTVSVLEASAGAGGFWLAAASDLAFGVPGIVLNPHYGRMGLYGSELHTYTGVRRLGSLRALLELKGNVPSLTVADASRLGLLDNALLSDGSRSGPNLTSARFLTTVQKFVGTLVEDRLSSFLSRKQETRVAHESMQSLDTYERLELIEMEQCIFGNRNQFREKRQAFVHKLSLTNLADSKKEQVDGSASGQSQPSSEDNRRNWNPSYIF